MKNLEASIPSPVSSHYVLGRERFEKFSAVEGIFLTEEEVKYLEEMARDKLPNNERRSLILARIKEVA